MARQLTEEHKAKMKAGREAAKLAQEESGEVITRRMNPVDRSNDDPNSLRKAIQANCYMCIYDPEQPGTWRDQVRSCVCTECPLHKVRM